jgi:hypothetical protein
VKNEHLIYAIGHKDDGTSALVVGITETGIKALGEKLTLSIEIPLGMRNIADVVFFSERTKLDLRARFAETGVPIAEYDWTNPRRGN